MFAYLGMGTVQALVNKEDPSPYLNAEAIDPKWMEEVQIDANKLHETKLKELEAKEEEQCEKSKENVKNADVA